MAMEYKCGQMEQGMKGNGDIIKLVVKANFGTLMEMYLKGSGKMIKQMDMVFMFT